MTGTKIYPKKSGVYFFLIMYGILTGMGGFMIAQAISRNQGPSGAAGFMVIFGVGMFILTLVKAGRPQVVLLQDFLELRQSRNLQLVRYRNIVGVTRPDRNRIDVTLREENAKKVVTIWLKELDPADVERLAEFLAAKVRKG